MLQRFDGWMILSGLRGWGDETPVLMFTERHPVQDRGRGLELGADDLAKPFAFSGVGASPEDVRLTRGGRGAARSYEIPDTIHIGSPFAREAALPDSGFVGCRFVWLSFCRRASVELGFDSSRKLIG
jgi:hypothetical protein